MDVKEFVETTLVQIIKGIAGAQDKVEPRGEAPMANVGAVNPAASDYGDGKSARRVSQYFGDPIEYVDFDIAVSAEEKAGAGGGIKVMGIGVKGEMDAKTGSVSRVKFRVPIELPRAK